MLHYTFYQNCLYLGKHNYPNGIIYMDFTLRGNPKVRNVPIPNAAAINHPHILPRLGRPYNNPP